MKKLSVEDIVKNNENCYSFVIAIAKRARQISEQANESGEMLDEKPVQISVQEFVEGKFRIAEKTASDDEIESEDTTDEQDNVSSPDKEITEE